MIERQRFIRFFITLLFVGAIVLPLSAGGNSEDVPANSRAEEGLRVYVSIPPQKYFVERIAGAYAEVSVMVPPGRSPATYDPTPKQVNGLGASDVFFTIGVPFEKAFLPTIEENMPNLRIVDTAEGIRRRSIQSTLSHEEDEHDHEEEMPDPHIWLSPRLVKKQGKNILDALVDLTPEHAREFRSNYKAFMEDLEELDAELQEILRPVKGSPLFVYHPSFGYFADDYGLKQLTIELGGNEPSPKQLRKVISLAKEKGVRVLFVQPEFSKTSARRVAEAIDGAVVEVAPLKPDYLENMKEIATAIRRGLDS